MLILLLLKHLLIEIIYDFLFYQVKGFEKQVGY